MDSKGNIVRIDEETERKLRERWGAGERVTLVPIDPDELPIVREMTRAGRREWSRGR